jgi:pimeloyl-ACP methyl ester carboxylesterase
MQRTMVEDPGRFQALLAATDEHDDLFKSLYVSYDEDSESVAGLRRRRRRTSNNLDDPIKAVSLVEQAGVLYWRDGIPGSERPSRHRRAGRGFNTGPSGTVVLAKQFPALEPNKIGAAIAAIDRRLNASIGDSLRSRLRQLRRSDGKFVLDEADVNGPFAGRTLLFVHGTFSNADNMIGELSFTTEGQALLNRAFEGDTRYDRVVFFEHATLAVSPVINALELGRAFAGSSGQIDVVAHSRGGLIVRWWLEAFGSSLRLDDNHPVRVIFAGAPLDGTSLASPARLQHALSLITNIGTFAATTLKLVGPANPFLWVGGKFVEVIVSVTGALAKTPIVDALVALTPGLMGQSKVSNNYELNRLRLGPCAVTPVYHAVKSNFETTNPGWQFWRNFRKDRLADIAADYIFENENDLVVDTDSMTDLGEADFALKMSDDVCDFGKSDTVWHCNYFRQEKTIRYIAEKFS